jgi:hypothetical protein
METATMIQYEDFLHRLQGAEDKGKYIVAPCPFHHDNSPSLLIFKDGWFHCLAADCSRSGTWKTLWNKISGQPIHVQAEKRIHYSSPKGLFSFESREELAYKSHLDLVQFPTFQWYLEMRGLADAIDIHEIGYYRGWYTFPVWDKEGTFTSLVFRAAPHVQEATGHRYWSDYKPTMYVPDWRLLDRCDYVIVVFGILDALTLNKFRLPVITPTHGHVFDPLWLFGYRKNIYVIPDKGEEKKALRLISDLGWRGQMVNLDFPTGMKDTNDFLKAGKDKELLAQLERHIR